MKTISIVVYEYSELSEKAKKVALDDYQSNQAIDIQQIEMEWLQQDHYPDIFKEVGFEIKSTRSGYQVYFSFDRDKHLSATIDDIDYEKVVDKEDMRFITEHDLCFDIEVNRYGYYTIELSKWCISDDEEDQDSVVLDKAKDIGAFILKKLNELVSKEIVYGEAVINSVMEESVMLEHFEANEIMFRSNGLQFLEQ